MQTNAHNSSKELQGFVECCSLALVDGPVTVGMSLDIASIDTISEINMVRRLQTTRAVMAPRLRFHSVASYTTTGLGAKW